MEQLPQTRRCSSAANSWAFFTCNHTTQSMQGANNKLHAVCQSSTWSGAAQLFTCSSHTGGVGVAPGLARRWALVLLHSLVPYALERAAPSGAASGVGETDSHAFAPGQPHRLQDSAPEAGEVQSSGSAWR